MSRRGIALLDCLVYIALLTLLLGLAFSCFYETTRHTRRLARNTADIIRALQAGERWREDIRQSSTIPRLEREGDETLLVLPRTNGVVRYTFRGGVVWRQALPKTSWVEALPDVKRSEMIRDQRARLVSWRWEIELGSERGKRHLVPTFTFQSVPRDNASP